MINPKLLEVMRQTGVSHPLLKKVGYGQPNSGTDIERQVGNYQQRISSTGEDVPLWKKALNPVLKGLMALDKPRNAIWNATEDVLKGENGFAQGLKEGWTGEEHYYGTDLMKDVFGKPKTKLGKVGQWIGGFGLEVLGDPLSYVTFGTGSLAKGFLTGSGKSLTKESAEKLAKVGLRKVNREATERVIARGLKESGERVTKSQFDELVNNAIKVKYADEFAKVGIPEAEVKRIFDTTDISDFYDDTATYIKNTQANPNMTIDEIEKLHQMGRAGTDRIDDFVGTAEVFKNAETRPIGELEDAFKEFTKNARKNGATNTAEFFDMWARAGYNADDLQRLGKTLKIDSQDFGKFFDDVGYRNMDELQDAYIKQMNEAYDKIVYNKAGYDTAIKDKALAVYDNALMDADKKINSLGKGLSAFGITPRGLTNARLQDIGASASQKLVNKGGIAGNTVKVLQDSIGKMFDTKFVAGLNGSERSVLSKLKKASLGNKNVNDEYLIQVAKEFDSQLKELEKLGTDQKDKIVGYLEGTVPPSEVNPKALGIANHMKDIYKNMAHEELDVRALRNIMDENYFPHVPNWSNDSIGRQIKLGGVTEKLKLNNLSARGRGFADDLPTANKQMLFHTASEDAKKKFTSSLGIEDYKRLDTETVREIDKLMGNEDAWQILKDGGGVTDYFESDPVKALITRGLRHNKVVADKNFLDDVAEAFGEKVYAHNIAEFREAGYDIVIPKSVFKSFKINGVGRLGDLTPDMLEQLPKDINYLLKKLLDEDMRAFATIDGNDFALLSKYTPVQAYALPQGVKETINNASRNQIKQGYDVLGNAIDRFYALWKPTVTGLRPDFHLRNLAGSSYQNMMDIGFKTVDPRINKIAMKVAGSTDEAFEIGGTRFTAQEIRNAMTETHAKSTMFRADPRKMENVLNDELTKYGIKNPIKSASKLGRKAGDIIEDRVRSVNFVANLEKGLDLGLSKSQAIQYAGDQVSKFHFDYTDLTDIERNLFRRIAPFYTWVRKNLPLQTEQFLNDPAKFTRILKLQRSGQEAMRMDTENMPEWFSSGVPLPLGKKADGKDAYLNGSLPMADLMMLGDPKDFLNMASPFIKLPFEFANNSQMLTGAPIWDYPEEKNMKMLQHALSQFGVFRDVSKTVRPQNTDGRAVAPLQQMPLGVGESILKSYSPEDAREDSLYQYNRDLGNRVQYLKEKGVNVPDKNQLNKMSQQEIEFFLKNGIEHPLLRKLRGSN